MKLSNCLNVLEHAKLSVNFEVWKIRLSNEGGGESAQVCAQIDAKTIRSCHAKLKNTGSVMEFRVV